MFNVIKFYQDHGIDYKTEGHKHCRPGWIQVECPLCSGEQGYHLGFNLERGYFHCWRCGGHSIDIVIRTLLSCSKGEAILLLKKYDDVLTHFISSPKKKSERCVFPPETVDMGPYHKSYLSSRGFNPDGLERVWGLKGTGPVGAYSHRIIAPIFFNKRMVSYQGRDITDKAELRYKACESDKEILDHKTILYGWDLVPGSSVVIVEGITDAWRMGPGSLATFGIGYKREQVLLISKKFRRVFILFDNDEKGEGQEAADRLFIDLKNYMRDVQIVELIGYPDPAKIPDDEADYFMKSYGIRKF